MCHLPCTPFSCHDTTVLTNYPFSVAKTSNLHVSFEERSLRVDFMCPIAKSVLQGFPETSVMFAPLGIETSAEAVLVSGH